MTGAAEKARDLKALRKQINALDLGRVCLEEQQTSPHPEHMLKHGFHECVGQDEQDFSTVLGFALAAAGRVQTDCSKPVLVCTLAGNAQEYGALYPCGLSAFGIDFKDVLSVEVNKEPDLYWVAEECLSSDALSAVILTGGYQEKSYDFTISRRLKLRSEESTVPLYLIRNWKQSDATAANGRWRVRRMASSENALVPPGRALPGSPRFQVQLEKPVSSSNQVWIYEYDATCGFRLAAPLANRPSRKTKTIQRAA